MRMTVKEQVGHRIGKNPSFILPLDVRAKQRLCYLACPLNSELRVGGFAPRHLSR